MSCPRVTISVLGHCLPCSHTRPADESKHRVGSGWCPPLPFLEQGSTSLSRVTSMAWHRKTTNPGPPTPALWLRLNSTEGQAPITMPFWWLQDGGEKAGRGGSWPPFASDPMGNTVFRFRSQFLAEGLLIGPYSPNITNGRLNTKSF